MEKYIYINLRERPELMKTAADWFHSKWGVPTKAYLDCMNAYIRKETEYGCGRHESQGNHSDLFGYRPYLFL